MSPTSYQLLYPAILICGAGNRGRTGTRITSHGILSPGRLPIPPFRHLNNSMAPRVGLEPTTYRLTADCSAIELPRNIVPRILRLIHYTYKQNVCQPEYGKFQHQLLSDNSAAKFSWIIFIFLLYLSADERSPVAL